VLPNLGGHHDLALVPHHGRIPPSARSRVPAIREECVNPCPDRSMAGGMLLDRLSGARNQALSLSPLQGRARHGTALVIRMPRGKGSRENSGNCIWWRLVC
jgi:hypothetical protein